MAKRTYVPQLARMCLRLSLYIQKHQATITPFLTTAQVQALDNCLPCLQTLAALFVRETP